MRSSFVSSTVIAGLVPATHDLDDSRGGAEARTSRETSASPAAPRESFVSLNNSEAWMFMGGRDKPGHDDGVDRSVR